MRQPLKFPQRIQVRQFRDIIPRQHERLQVRDVICERRLDDGDPIAGEQQRRQPRGQREVSELLDVVIREVDSILGLSASQSVSTMSSETGGVEERGRTYAGNTEILNRGDLMTFTIRNGRIQCSIQLVDQEKCSIMFLGTHLGGPTRGH